MWPFFQLLLPKLPFGGVFPKVKAEEEPAAEDLVDPQQELRDECRDSDEHVKHQLEKYEACNERVNSRSKTTETCTEELFDYLHALDHCVTKSLFSRLK